MVRIKLSPSATVITRHSYGRITLFEIPFVVAAGVVAAGVVAAGVVAK